MRRGHSARSSSFKSVHDSSRLTGPRKLGPNQVVVVGKQLAPGRDASTLRDGGKANQLVFGDSLTLAPLRDRRRLDLDEGRNRCGPAKLVDEFRVLHEASF